MGEMTKRFTEAIDAVSAMPADQQDLIASELIERVRSLAEPAAEMSEDDRRDLEVALAEARAGKRATEAEVAAVFAKYGA